ncbi:MAG: hypothetical protein AB2598_20045 [Candidatus Thiodiazotropha sp.]
MPLLDIDRTHRNRIEGIWNAWREDKTIEINDIFFSDQVLESLDEQKVLFESFRIDRLLTTLPFTNHAYVKICPYCVTQDTFEIFKALVNENLIIPIFTDPYNEYPKPITDFIKTKDHISVYEFIAFRTIVLHGISSVALCEHCIDKRIKELHSVVKGKRGAPKLREYLEISLANINPYVDPDYALLDEFVSAFNEFDLDKAKQLRDLSYYIHASRNSQSFNSALIVPDTDIIKLPAGTIDENTFASRLVVEMREMIVDGLGLNIPAEMPIKNYIGLLKEYRPQLLSLSNEIITSGEDQTNPEVSLRKVFNIVSDINKDIERIETSKRYLAYQAVVSLMQNNKEILSSALIAGAMGMGGSVIGCATTLTGGALAHVLKKKGKLKGSTATKKLGRAIHRDLQPYVSKLVAKYVDSSEVTVQVMTIREGIRTKTG